MDKHFKKIFKYAFIIALASFTSLFILGIIHGAVLGTLTPRQLVWAHERAEQRNSGGAFGNMAPINEIQAEENAALLREGIKKQGWPVGPSLRGALGFSVLFLLFATLHRAAQELLKAPVARKWALVLGGAGLTVALDQLISLPNTSYLVGLASMLTMTCMLFKYAPRFRILVGFSFAIGFLGVGWVPMDMYYYLHTEIMGEGLYFGLGAFIWAVPAYAVSHYFGLLRRTAEDAGAEESGRVSVNT